MDAGKLMSDETATKLIEKNCTFGNKWSLNTSKLSSRQISHKDAGLLFPPFQASVRAAPGNPPTCFSLPVPGPKGTPEELKNHEWLGNTASEKPGC